MNFYKYLLKDKKKLNKKIFIDKDYTYAQLFADVNLVSKNLRKYKRQLIGISFDNSYEFIVYYLSIINSNNIAVVIEKGLPLNKYFKILDKYKINIFFTDLNFEKKKINKKFDIISKILGSNKKKFFKVIRKNKLKKKVDKKYFQDVCLILFTSGSTGEKKGVMLTNKNLIANTNSIIKVLPIKKKDVVNLILPLSYSFGLSVLNTHIKIGSSFFFHNSPFVGSVINEIREKKCTCLYGVPSTFQILIDKTNFLKNNFDKINFIAQAGGNLNSNYKTKLAKKFKSKFLVMYGATEASPRLSYLNPKYLLKKIDSIGKPLKDIKFKLFKDSRKKYSELGVSGKNIMKGYLFDKKLTAGSFKKNFYLTGDLASKDEDGFYYIIKRKDKIFKRFGFKIQPSIIENKLNNLSFVKKSKIQLLENNRMILKVFVEQNINEIQNKIKTVLRSNFTSYEIPDKIIIIKPEDQVYNKKD